MRTTTKEAPARIDVLSENDLNEAMQLVATAQWNQTRQDWLRLVRLAPQGCFGAWSNDALVGTITTISYRTDLAWIGMMFVSLQHRRRGVATQLMRVAMDYLARRGVATVKLDATPVGRPLYEALGFVPERLIERWERIARPILTSAPSELTVGISPNLQLLDGQAFQTDRTGLLQTLLHDACVTPLTVTSKDGSLCGYATARQGTAARYIGPFVATDEQSALTLLDGLIHQLAGERVYLDYHTGFGLESSALPRRNFSKQRDLMRMQYGKPSTLGTSPMVLAIAGPELG